MKLNQLKRDIKPFVSKGIGEKEYDELIHSYDDILRDYENHIDADYKLTRWQEFNKELDVKRKRGEIIPIYPKTFWIYNKRWELIYLQIGYTARFYAAIVVSILMLYWPT